ncbi:MAG: hypothetical protein P1V51_24420, partial [Deltaproteobacteria bacterium]|nr:hypothetical protein [Deltaproteobacteria bacterium]
PTPPPAAAPAPTPAPAPAAEPEPEPEPEPAPRPETPAPSDPAETVEATPAPLPPAEPSISQVFLGESLGTPLPAGARAGEIDPSSETGGAAWGPDMAATSGVYDAASIDDAFLLDELWEDPFVKARRRRRKIVLAALGVVAALGALAGLLAVMAPATFDDLIGKRVGLRMAWDAQAVVIRSEGRALLLRDDPEALKLAIEKLRAAHELDPQYPEAATDLAAAHFLLSSIVRADGRAVVDAAGETSARMRAVTEQMKKARGPKYERLQKEAQAHLGELQALDRRSTEFMEEAGKLNAAGYAIARANHDANQRSVVAMTGLALYYGLEDEPGPAETLLSNIEAFGAKPPLARLGEAWLLVSGEMSQRRREAALTAFDALVAAEPDLLRARVGRIQALLDLGRADEAKAAEEELLGINPKHPVGKLLRR